MRESIMFLSSPSASLDVVYRRDICSPSSLSSHFVELAILDHHGVDNTQETLIGREDSSSTGQGVPIEISYRKKYTLI